MEYGIARYVHRVRIKIKPDRAKLLATVTTTQFPTNANFVRKIVQMEVTVASPPRMVRVEMMNASVVIPVKNQTPPGPFAWIVLLANTKPVGDVNIAQKEHPTIRSNKPVA
jgi:hypothetical protein